MFTGLVQTVGIIRAIQPQAAGHRLVVEAPAIAAGVGVLDMSKMGEGAGTEALLPSPCCATAGESS